MISHLHPSIEPAITIFKKLRIRVGLEKISKSELDKHGRKEASRLNIADFDTLRKFHKHYYRKRYNNQQLALGYVNVIIEKIGTQLGNNSWRRVSDGKTKFIQVDIDESKVVRYKVDSVTDFVSVYAEYLRDDITVHEIEKRISSLKSADKRVAFKGRIGDAAEAVVKKYNSHPDQYTSLKKAAKEFFDAHKFVNKKKSYAFKTFWWSVSKANVNSVEKKGIRMEKEGLTPNK